MADKEIADLTDGGNLASGDVLHVFRTPNSRKAVVNSAALLAIIAATTLAGYGITDALKQGKREYYLDGSVWRPRAANGFQFVDYDSGANDVTGRFPAFDTTAQEYGHLWCMFPKSWNGGTVTFKPIWTNTGGSSTQNVQWSLAGRALANDDAINGAFGTAQTSDDTWLAQNDLHVGPESSAITIGNSPATGKINVLELSRVVGSDNMAGDALFIGMVLGLTLNAADDT